MLSSNYVSTLLSFVGNVRVLIYLSSKQEHKSIFMNIKMPALLPTYLAHFLSKHFATFTFQTLAAVTWRESSYVTKLPPNL